MKHEHLTDILTPEQIRDARFEAEHRHPNLNMDEIMELEFKDYITHKTNSILREETGQEILYRLEGMVELQYSPVCIMVYEQVYRALKDNLEQGDNYGR